MHTARNFFLFAAITLWATIIGAIVYSHVVFLPAYLHHLPSSTALLQGDFAIHDEYFWIPVHPVHLVFLATATALNWKLKERRNYMLSAIAIYVVVLVTTFFYFVPELMAFAKSAGSGLPASEWLERGERWERLSWIRGAFMYAGFVLLLLSLMKTSTEKQKTMPYRNKAVDENVLAGYGAG